MPRFSSLDYAPSETRRLLRERLQRQLGREPGAQAPAPDGPVLGDEAMLHLLQSLDVRFGDDWVHTLATYQAALPSDGSEPPLEDRIAAGWARVVWGRVKISRDVTRSLRASSIIAGAFARVLEQRFIEEYSVARAENLEGELLAIARQIERGEIALPHLSCRSPAWVAARLWDRTLSDSGDSAALRTWVDCWKALSAPKFAPSKVWDGPAGERFRQAALQVLEAEPALEGWDETRARFVRELAAARGRTPQEVEPFFGAPPQTLVDRALWQEDNRVVTLARESLDACDDLMGLVRLLLADIEMQPFSGAPHPLAARLFELARSRPDVFLNIVLSVSWRPRLLADLLLHPPTCALACLIIAQWRPGSSAFDRELVQRSDEWGKAAAFEDAVSILAWWLEKGSVAPAEAAALLAWLHRSAGNGFIDDLAEQERLRMFLRNALVGQGADTFEAMVDALVGAGETSTGVGARFAAALEFVVIGDLADRIDPAPLLNAYVDALARDEFSLSVQRIGVEGAAALFALAQRVPKLRERFLLPFNVRARLAQGDEPGANLYAVTDAVVWSLRAHIRILCRAIAGHKEPAPDLAAALISAVRSGTLAHREKGRVAAFAPRYETNTLGVRRDRPVAADLAAALKALSGAPREQLLSVILETDEPMVLAQLLPLAPREARSAIEQRLEALPPSDAGATYSLIEVQARIDELLSAGALGAAAKFIEEEERLQTLGKVQGREVARLRSTMRLLFARRAWNEIMSAQPSPDFGPVAKDDANEVLQFYKGLTLLVRPDGGRDPRAAEAIFQALRLRKPNVAAYAVNVVAAQIGALLPDDMFGLLAGAAAQRAQQVLAESDVLDNSTAPLSRADRETLACNQAILRLALGEPGRALMLLPSTAGTHLDERVQAYRAVALSRLDRPQEAVSALKAAEDSLGRTELLEAAWAHIRDGVPFAGSAGVTSNDDPVARIRDAYRDLHLLDPIQQSAVVSLDTDPFTAFVVEQVRGAAASVVALVPMMDFVTLDGCEDDVTALIRELLLSRLDFLRWSAPDQSKGGVTPKGNPGERDLMIMRGSTILTVIEAVICRNPIHWETVQENLKTHFQRLLAYGTCRLFFHLTYVFGQDIQRVIDTLRVIAADEAPPGFVYAGLTDIALTDSRPHGFVARYGDGQGELKVVFLALNMGQERQKAAAAASAKAKG